MKKLASVALIAAVCAACGASDVKPTPRPAGQRGPILNPVDKARDTANRTEEKTSEVQRYGGEYEQGNNPALDPQP